MHVALTIVWTLGMVLTVGSLLLVNPFPWVLIGVAVLVYGARMLRAEIRSISARSQHSQIAAINRIKRPQGSTSAKPSNSTLAPSTNPYDRPNDTH